MACLNRIGAFLNLPEREDERVVQPNASQSPDFNTIVRVKQLTAQFAGKDDVTLRDISLDIEKATVNAIVGPIGCGKSVLLKALLGELPISSGNITIKTKSVAFCDQTP